MTEPVKKRILIVDDMPDWRKLLSNLLDNYEIKALATYKEAVDAIEQWEFDVAVLDIRLEDENIWNVDGIDLLEKIKEKHPMTSLIILTGYRQSARDSILLDYAPNEILDKETFDNTRFREIINNLAMISRRS